MLRIKSNFSIQLGQALFRNMSTKIKGTKRIKDISENVWTEYTALAAAHKAVNLGQGFPDFSPLDHVKAALATASNGPNHMFNQYTRGAGHPKLVNVLSKVYGKLMARDIDPMKEILITTGAYGALFCTFQAFIEEGDEVIIIEPFYDCYKPMTLMAGGVPKYVSLKPKYSDQKEPSSADWVFDEDELKAAFTEKTKAIVVNNPHNPLGKIYTKDELQMIADLCKKHNVLCISDEVYEWLQYGDAKHIRIGTLPGMWDRTVTIGSAGKTFSVTGWKIGWAMGAPHLVTHLSTVWQNCCFHSNTPAAEAVANAFEKEFSIFDSVDCYFKALPKELQAKRDAMIPILKDIGMKPIVPDGGYFMVADISGMDPTFGADEFPNNIRDERLVKWMTVHKKVATIPCSAFFSNANKELGSNYVRFCFCKNEETLNNMEAIFKQWKNEL